MQTQKSPVSIYVDGSFSNGRAAYAALIMADGEELARLVGVDVSEELLSMRNVGAEMTAVVRALAWCRKQSIPEVTIYFDYQGLESWVIGAWKAKNPYTQKYAAFVQNCGVSITWRKVKAHSGNQHNEIVDGLARSAAQTAEGKAI